MASRPSGPVVPSTPTETDLTEEQARTEARRRWGLSGTVRLLPLTRHQREGERGRLARYRYLVGNGRLGARCTILGQGDSWRQAFDDAKPRGALDEARAD